MSSIFSGDQRVKYMDNRPRSSSFPARQPPPPEIVDQECCIPDVWYYIQRGNNYITLMKWLTFLYDIDWNNFVFGFILTNWSHKFMFQTPQSIYKQLLHRTLVFHCCCYCFYKQFLLANPCNVFIHILCGCFLGRHFNCAVQEQNHKS